MTDGTVAHQMIGGNLRAALHERLRGSLCRSLGPTLKVEVAARIRYPDAFVSCTPAPRGATVIRDPVVVFEVLSESVPRTDRIEKLREYQATPSIRRYVILEQDAIAAMVFVRKGEDWVVETLAGDDVLAMPEIGISLPLAEAYSGVELPAEATDNLVPRIA